MSPAPGGKRVKSLPPEAAIERYVRRSAADLDSIRLEGALGHEDIARALDEAVRFGRGDLRDE